MKDPVVQLAHEALQARLREAADVSQHTKDAQRIAKLWRASVVALDANRYQHEAPVDPAFDQRIDILDTTGRVAYELKVSGKNAHNELYKDVVKILLYNQSSSRTAIQRLVFIADEAHGRQYLDTPMITSYRRYLGDNGLQVDIEYVRVG
jgi:hypothetical protein